VTATELVEQREEGGQVYALHRRGEAYDVTVDGQLICATDQPRNEEQLVELAVAPLRGRDDATVLLAGLGTGRTLRHILDAKGLRVVRVDVVEGSPAMVDWGKQYFAATNGDALADPRVHLHKTTLLSLIRQVRLGAPNLLPEEGAMALIVDTDHGPDGLLRKGNEAHYTDDGLGELEMALRPGGVLALWSNKREPELTRRLTARFQNIAEVVVPVDAPNALDYIYRARRHAATQTGPASNN
jgi:spermidine synthase